jgi:hypothetical protein
MRPRDDCIINNNGTNWYFAFLKAISASCKAFFIKYSSVKIFSIKQKYSNLFVHLPYVKIYFQVFITLSLRQLDEVQLPQLAQNYVILLLI